ncbi:MAG: divergent polysaccharide deacetylase family protein [Deltaproteobacteria bacterium]|nr:divergent polysaccharide deacetylase family protein [Deltaproteobacteria bacterium]
MANRGRRGGSAGGRLWVLALLAAVAVAIGFVAGHLTRDLGYRRTAPPLPRRSAGPTLAEQVETLVGPLDAAGTRVPVADRGAARHLLSRLERLARENPRRLQVDASPEERSRLRVRLTVGSDSYPAEIVWPEEAAPGPGGGATGARLALVIDDLGADAGLARDFLDLEVPVTPAVLPYLAHSLDVAHLARGRGREFLLHVPMEPQEGRRANPGKGALLSSMSEAEVRAGLEEALSSVPGAAGVNNHMGSRLTELSDRMTWVMDELRQKDLYFLDSVTSPRTVASTAARAAGIGWARRDVFLDNEQDVQTVGRQLDQAMQKARRNGSAIAIGHPHRGTLEALRLWIPKFRAAGVEIVPLGGLIQRPTG